MCEEWRTGERAEESGPRTRDMNENYKVACILLNCGKVSLPICIFNMLILDRETEKQTDPIGWPALSLG